MHLAGAPQRGLARRNRDFNPVFARHDSSPFYYDEELCSDRRMTAHDATVLQSNDDDCSRSLDPGEPIDSRTPTFEAVDQCSVGSREVNKFHAASLPGTVRKVPLPTLLINPDRRVASCHD